MFVNRYGLSDRLFNRIVSITESFDYDFDKSRDWVSATTLCSPPRVAVLNRRYGHLLASDPSDAFFMILGSAVHEAVWLGMGNGKLLRLKAALADKILSFSDFTTADILSAVSTYKGSLSNISVQDRYICEKRYRTDVLGRSLSGKLDVYDTIEKEIIDYKLTSVTKIMKASFGDWEHQLNVYAYILRCNGFIVKSICVNALLRDWQRSKTRDSGYPKQPIVEVSLPLWSFERARRWIEGRASQLSEAFELNDENLPICTMKERWEDPTTWAVREVAGYFVTRDSVLTLVESCGDVAFSLRELIGERYSTSDKLYEDICRVCGKDFAESNRLRVESAVGNLKQVPGGKPKKAMRVRPTYEEAVIWMEETTEKVKSGKRASVDMVIETREAVPKRCYGNYCGVRDFCSYWKSHRLNRWRS
ncbi:MAG: hypothetical protein GY861_21435 [bacterium]|nr:hypothetical protein [bacterium]